MLSISRNTLSAVLLSFLLINIYCEIPFDLGDGKVLPAYPYILFMPITLYWIRRNITRSDLKLLIKIELVFIASILFSAGIEYWSNKLLGTLQITISVIAGLLLFRLITLVTHRSFERIMLFGWACLLVGAFLEVAGPIKGISDAFRYWAFNSGGYSAYSNEARDVAMAGHVRPNFFSSEPSLLAIGFMIFVNGWFTLRPSSHRFAVVVLATCIAFFVVASPIIILSLLMTITCYFSSIQKKRLLLFGFAIVMSSIVVGWGIAQSSLISSRFAASNFGDDIGSSRSENIRLYLPFMTAFTVAQVSPAFGVGMSGKKIAANIVNLPLVETNHLVSNNVATLFIYLGFVGAALMIYILLKYMRLVGINRVHLIIFSWFCLGISTGGFESPRFWGYLFLIVGVYFHADKFRSQQQPVNQIDA